MMVVNVICGEQGVPYSFTDASIKNEDGDLRIVHTPTKDTLAFFVHGYWRAYIMQDINEEKPVEPTDKDRARDSLQKDTAAS